MAPPRADRTPRRAAPPPPSRREAPPPPSRRAAPPPPSSKAAPPPTSSEAAPPPPPKRAAMDIEYVNLKLHIPADEIEVLPGFYDASQTIFGMEHPVLCRVYPILDPIATEHFKFLRGFKDPHMLQPDYMLTHENQSVFVFNQKLSCSLSSYLKNNPPNIFCTGSKKSILFSRDFKEPIISVLWQLAGAINESHDQDRWLGGPLPLEEMFVSLAEGVHKPRLFLLPSFHEKRARDGKELMRKPATENLKSLDFYWFGNVIHSICDALHIQLKEAYEIYHLINKLMLKEVSSIDQILRHPALINEDMKLILVKDSQEGIFKQYKLRYFEPTKVFSDPPHFVTDPWTVKYERILNNLDETVREGYNKADEPNNLYNIRLLSANVVKHLDSHQELKNNFGDGANFLRFLTATYYPRYFIDLIDNIGVYSNNVARRLQYKMDCRRPAKRRRSRT